MIFHLGKAKTILRVSVALNDERKDFTLFFEVAGELGFEIFGLGLSQRGGYLSVEVGDEELSGLGAG